MAAFNCCASRRDHSPPDRPIQLRDITDDGRRMTISTDFSAEPSFELDEPPRRIHDIFYSADNSRLPITPHSNQFRLRSRESLQLIHHVTKKIKDKVSRDSSEAEYRKGRVEREHKQADLTDNSSIVQDEDAIAIKTPRGTWSRQSRQDGAVQMSPHELKRLLNRSSTPSPQPSMRRPSTRTFLAPQSPAKAKARVLSKMLTDRAGLIDEQAQAQNNTEKLDSKLAGRQRPRKYTFSDIDSPQRSETRTPSIKVPISQQAADLKPRWPSSATSGGVKGNTSRSNTVGPFGVNVSEDLTGTSEQTPNESIGLSVSAFNPRHAASVFHDNKSRPYDKEFSGGTSDSVAEGIERSNSNGSTRSKSLHLYDIGISRRLGSNSQPHFMQVRSSSQLRTASCTNLGGGTGLDHHSRKARRYASSSTFAGLKESDSMGSPKRTAASSSYSSHSQYESFPMTRNISRHSVISEHNFQPNQHLPSQSAVGKVNAFLGQPIKDTTQLELLDGSQTKEIFEKLEVAKLTTRQSQSPSKPLERSRSLTVSEIERIERDLLGAQAHTTANIRFFSQAELKELSEEVAKKRPPSAEAINRFDGESEGRVPSELLLLAPPSSREASSVLDRRSGHGSVRNLSDADLSPSRKPSAIAGIDPIGSSVWDNALREHAREDAKLRRKNAGSVSADHDVQWHTTRNRQSALSLLQNRSSNRDPENDIQAQLNAYRLRSRSKASISRTAHRASSSTSTSSWARYPSYSRRERIDSPATPADNVISRDFAQQSTPSVIATSRSLDAVRGHGSSPLKAAAKFKRRVKKTHSAQFFKRSFRDLYHTKSIQIAAKLAIDDAKGHRSSVSEGVGGSMTEYPELEMLSPLPMSPSYEGLAGDYFRSFEDRPMDPKVDDETVQIGASKGSLKQSPRASSSKKVESKKATKSKKEKKSKIPRKKKAPQEKSQDKLANDEKSTTQPSHLEAPPPVAIRPSATRSQPPFPSLRPSPQPVSNAPSLCVPERTFTPSPPPPSMKQRSTTLYDYSSCIDLPEHALCSSATSPITTTSIRSPPMSPVPLSIGSLSSSTAGRSDHGSRSRSKGFSYAQALGEHFSPLDCEVGEQGGSGWEEVGMGDAGGKNKVVLELRGSTEEFSQALEARARREKDIFFELGKEGRDGMESGSPNG